MFLIVEPLPNSEVIDLDTLLFTDERKIIGKVFDVFGQVSNPYYSILLSEKNIGNYEEGTLIFYVPETTKKVDPKVIYTKGCDASGLHDEEIDEKHMEYSDDEKEQMAHKPKKKKKQNKRKKEKIVKENEKIDSIEIKESVEDSLRDDMSPIRINQTLNEGEENEKVENKDEMPLSRANQTLDEDEELGNKGNVMPLDEKEKKLIQLK